MEMSDTEVIFAVCEKYGLKEQSVDCTYVYEEGIRAAGKMLNDTLMWTGLLQEMI